MFETFLHGKEEVWKKTKMRDKLVKTSLMVTQTKTTNLDRVAIIGSLVGGLTGAGLGLYHGGILQDKKDYDKLSTTYRLIDRYTTGFCGGILGLVAGGLFGVTCFVSIPFLGAGYAIDRYQRAMAVPKGTVSNKVSQ